MVISLILLSMGQLFCTSTYLWYSTNFDRERAKAFTEALSKLEEYCPNLSKKRPRGDISSSDRSNALFPGANVPKVGPQTHMNVNSLELGPQKMEERAKATVANRRVRTSMMEGRVGFQSQYF